MKINIDEEGLELLKDIHTLEAEIFESNITVDLEDN